MTDSQSNPAAIVRAPAALPGGVACWRRGVALCRRAPATLFVLALLARYAALVPDAAGMIAPHRMTAAGAGLAVGLAAAWLQAVFYGALILRLDRAAGSPGKPWPGPGAAVNLAIAAIIYEVAVGLGLVLFILPGFFISIAWLLFAFPIVLDGMGPIAGLAASWRWISPRFLRISAAVSIAFIFYSLYLVITWGPDWIGISWRPLIDLMINARQAAIPPLAVIARVRESVTPGAVAAPWWYFVLNPLLGGVVMPPVLGTLYWIYRAGRGVTAALPNQAGIRRG